MVQANDHDLLVVNVSDDHLHLGRISAVFRQNGGDPGQPQDFSVWRWGTWAGDSSGGRFIASFKSLCTCSVVMERIFTLGSLQKVP
jgi:hypothetical protein